MSARLRPRSLGGGDGSSDTGKAAMCIKSRMTEYLTRRSSSDAADVLGEVFTSKMKGRSWASSSTSNPNSSNGPATECLDEARRAVSTAGSAEMSVRQMTSVIDAITSADECPVWSKWAKNARSDHFPVSGSPSGPCGCWKDAFFLFTE
jgi:hypothetical protein